MPQTTATTTSAALGERLRGTVIGPDDPSYEVARAIVNRSRMSRPVAVAQCADVADVIAAVRFATEEGLEVAVRAGGHSVSGLSSADGGLVIDLTRMRHVDVDPQARVAVVGGGATAGDLDHATNVFGLATPSATVTTVGVAGFTLGGGIGYLNRAYGLAVDNLIGADVVLADGSFVQADAEHEPDLWWALRGGCGNFGVVTQLRMRLHPVTTVFGGPMLFPLEATDTVTSLYRDWMPQQPDDIYAFLALFTIPPVDPFPPALRLRPVCALIWCNTAPADRSRAAADTFRAAVPPLLDGVAELPYPALQSSSDAMAAAATHTHLTGRLYRNLPEQAAREFARFAGSAPTPLCQTHLYPLDGAAGRVGADETAWAWRAATFAQMFVAGAAGPGFEPELATWAEGFADALRPGALAGCYPNFLNGTGPDDAREAFGDHLDRLSELKSRYDPQNLFRRTINIAPR